MSTTLERAPVESPAERAARMTKLTRLQRWTRRMGYVACAWGLFFTLEHVYWVSGGSWLMSEAYMRPLVSRYPFAQYPWDYVTATGLLIAPFAILALFPLALTWQGKQSTQRHLQWMVVILGYIGLILMGVRNFAHQQTVLQTVYWLFSLGICVLGVGVAFVRPRSQSVEHWLVLVATWIFGAGMTLYGCFFIVIALLSMQTAYFMLFVSGGLNWTIEGILFVTVAWLATYSERFARRTMTSQPA